MEHKIELLTGYTDKADKVHREVVFSKRLTIGDYITIEGDRRSASQTQMQDLVLKGMITKFGDLMIPVSEAILLSLDSIDREDLQIAANFFDDQSKTSKPAEQFIDDKTIRLTSGFPLDAGAVANRIVFGILTTGRDDLEADGLRLTGVERELFLIGKEIVRIENDDATVVEAGSVSIDKFKTLDIEELTILRIGALRWKAAFRGERKALQGKRTGESGNGSNEGNKDVGTTDTRPTDAKA